MVGAHLDAGVEDLVENRGLECRDVEAGSGLVDGADGGGGLSTIGKLAEEAAFDFEDLGHGFLCGGEVSCRVVVAGGVLVLGCEWVGGAEEIESELWVAHDDGPADLVVVLEEPKALGAEAVGDALLTELLERAVRMADGGGIDFADADGEAVAGEVASFEFVGVEVHPLDGEFGVVECGEVFGFFARRMDGDDLLGDGKLIFEPSVADGAFVDFEMAGDDGDELERGNGSFFDEHVDVLAVSCGLVEGEFGDKEVFGPVLDGAADGWRVSGEVDRCGDGGVEGGEVCCWGGGGHERGL